VATAELDNRIAVTNKVEKKERSEVVSKVQKSGGSHRKRVICGKK
jgi:hypothetical protein